MMALEATKSIQFRKVSNLGLGWGHLAPTNSLNEFYEVTDNAIWARPTDNGKMIYLGGTGYAADGGKVRWGEYFKATGWFAGVQAGTALGVAKLLGGEVTPEGVLGAGGGGGGAIKAGQEFLKHAAAWQRSIWAARHHTTLRGVYAPF